MSTQRRTREAYMKRVMGFVKFKTTKNTKVPGNDKLYAVRKEKKTEYRQYMNRPGGFNRPLSPSAISTHLTSSVTDTQVQRVHIVGKVFKADWAVPNDGAALDEHRSFDQMARLCSASRKPSPSSSLDKIPPLDSPDEPLGPPQRPTPPWLLAAVASLTTRISSTIGSMPFAMPISFVSLAALTVLLTQCSVTTPQTTSV
ncbi:hypothetical protein MRB53_038694 [Persea americana]|nr:hypothetical protein MRB53_038694 [Persea americana]